MKGNKLKGMIEENNKYLEKFAEMAQAEGKYLELIQWQDACFGEIVLDLWESNSKTMGNVELSTDAQLMQSMYIHHTIAQQYQLFFDLADKVLEGKLSELFFDENLMERRTIQ